MASNRFCFRGSSRRDSLSWPMLRGWRYPPMRFLIPLLFALLLLAGCASPDITPAPIPTTHRTDAAGRYAGRDEVRTNAATGKPEVMHYDAKGKYIGISR